MIWERSQRIYQTQLWGKGRIIPPMYSLAPLVSLALFSAPLASVDGRIKAHRWSDRGWKWPSALNTGAELQSIRLSHFDSPSSLNCSVNLAAALSCLTYRSPESVLGVLCPTNRLLCPPSSPHSLSTRSDRPVMMIVAPPSPLSPAPQVPRPLSYVFNTPAHVDTAECSWWKEIAFSISYRNKKERSSAWIAFANKHESNI